MHVIADNSPLVPARTPKACDFTDRLRQLAYDVHVIELAIEGSISDGRKNNADFSARDK